MVLCSLTSVNAVNSVIVQNGSRSGVYSTIAAAITAAQTGDTIYIGAGLYSETLTISKALSIFGAGFFPDSTTVTNTTQITGKITVSTGASNLTLSGLSLADVYFNNSAELSNVTITRNYISNRIYGNSAADYFKMKNFKVSENYITGGTQFDNLKTTSNVLIEKNIFLNSYLNLINGNNNCFIKNNIFGKNSGIGNGVYYSSSYDYRHAYIYQVFDCTFANNLFISESTNSSYYYYYLSASSDRNTYYNNFYNAKSGAGFGVRDILSNNTYEATWKETTVFKSFSSWANYGFVSGNDLHVSESSGLNAAGTDGTELGIYGTVVPFKDGYMPRNPHVKAINIGIETNTNGELPISATVTAQPR